MGIMHNEGGGVVDTSCSCSCSCCGFHFLLAATLPVPPLAKLKKYNGRRRAHIPCLFKPPSSFHASFAMFGSTGFGGGGGFGQQQQQQQPSVFGQQQQQQPAFGGAAGGGGKSMELGLRMCSACLTNQALFFARFWLYPDIDSIWRYWHKCIRSISSNTCVWLGYYR